MKRYYLYAILILAPLALIAGWFARKPARSATAPKAAESAIPTSVDSPESASSWAVGSRRSYRFDYAASAKYAVTGDAAQAGSVAMTLSGVLSTTVISRDARSRTVEVVVVPEKVDLGQMPLSITKEALSRELTRPFAVTYGNDGAAERIALPEQLVRPASGILRDLVSQLQVTQRPGPAWVSVESEPMGDCMVAMRRLPDGRIGKQKQRFVKVTRGGELLAPEKTVGVPSFVRSEATYRLDSGGRVLDADIHHVTLAQVEVVNGSAESEVRATFRHTTTSAGPVPQPVAGLVARPLSDGRADMAKTTEKDQRQVRPVVEVMADFKRARAGNDHTLQHQVQFEMSRSFAANPASLEQVKPDDLSQPVLSAMGSAGSPEAQGKLAEIALDPKQPLDRRREATDAFHEVPEATSESANKLLDLADREPELRENALLALGGLANRKGATDPDSAAAWTDELVARYERATSDPERIQVLDALGNSGNEAAIPIVKAALESGSLEVRIAAAKNLRLLPAPQADQLITALFAPETEPQIRAAALFAASFRQLAPMQQGLAQVLKSEPDAELRMTALNTLATYLKRDGATDATPLIRWSAENDPDERVREQALDALKG